jgi:hypothetical protein
MARAATTEGNTKSDIVREYLKGNPTATVQDIVQDLKRYEISRALAQKIKYKDGSSGGRRGRKPGRTAAASAAAAQPSSENERKADSIRRVAGGMGKRVRPRDVVASLREEGIDVTSAQVSQVLKGMGMRRRRRGRKPAGERTARGRAVQADASTSLSLDALIAAKKLADQLGGVQAAKQAMDALARLS